MAVYLGSNQVDMLGGDGIPSAYLIPSGTYSISQNGVYDIKSYESVDISFPHYEAYKYILTHSTISASNSVLSNYFDTLSSIRIAQFADLQFSGNFNFPEVISMGSNAFGHFEYHHTGDHSCTFSFPKLQYIPEKAFVYLSNMTACTMPLCVSIGWSAFASCLKLSSVNFPNCEYISNHAFGNCTNLTWISFPNCISIADWAFDYCCYSLTSVNFPNCSYIGNYAFHSCYSLTTVSFPNCSYIGSWAFQDCYNLLSLYLLGSSIPSLVNSNAFRSTPISNYTTSTGGVYGSIYVPASLYNDYLTASNWSVYSSRIVSV